MLKYFVFSWKGLQLWCFWTVCKSLTCSSNCSLLNIVACFREVSQGIWRIVGTGAELCVALWLSYLTDIQSISHSCLDGLCMWFAVICSTIICDERNLTTSSPICLFFGSHNIKFTATFWRNFSDLLAKVFKKSLEYTHRDTCVCSVR